MSMSPGVEGGVKDSGMSDSDIDTCGVSQAAAASPIDNGSLQPLVLQPFKDDSINADVSHYGTAKEQPLCKSAGAMTDLAKEMSYDDSSASVWWHNELDRLDIFQNLHNSAKFCKRFFKN